MKKQDKSALKSNKQAKAKNFALDRPEFFFGGDVVA